MKKTTKNDELHIDRALVEQAQAGDQGAFSELYELTSPQIYRTIHAMVRDEVLSWDVQQETYIRAWKSLDKLRDTDALMPWLRHIAVNVTATELRRKKEVTFTELAKEDGQEPVLPEIRIENQPELSLEQKELSRQVREIVSELSPEQQAVMGMFYFEQMSVNEIAETLGVTSGTVKNYLYRGRKGVEKKVRALEKRGISLFGLTPVSYLMALLRRLEPESEKSQKAIGAILEQAPAGAATVTAITAGQALFHSIWTKLLALSVAAALIVGGKYGYDALKKGREPELGDWRPPAVETAVPEENREPNDARLRNPINKLLDLLPDDLKSDPSPAEPTEPSEENLPEPSEENPVVPAPDQPDPNVPAPPDDDTPRPSENDNQGPPEPSETAPSEQSEPSASEEAPDETEPEIPIIDRGTWGDNLSWTLDENGKLTISGTGDMQAFEFIDDSEFHKYQTQVTSLALSEGLTSISENAFLKFSNLTSVIIPDGVTTIGKSAFEQCSRLSTAVIPNSVISIGVNAFHACTSLTDVSLSPKLATIEGGAFSACESLRSVILPDSVSSVGDYAFEGCINLTEFFLPNREIQFGDAVFWGCLSLKSVTLDPANRYYRCDESSVLYGLNNSEIIFCPTSFTGSYAIPAGTVSVWGYAFYGCEGLISVTVPESVRIIRNHAFGYCSGLREVTLSEGLETIGRDAFIHCIGLTSVTIPDGVTEIEWEAFTGCTALSSITIPESVTRIGDRAFFLCDQLTIYGVPGSYAEEYANANGIPFEPISE